MMNSRFASRELIGFYVLTLLSCMFILNSFPFMYPGYDMWWHVGSIDASQLGSKGAQGRFYWHHFWHWLLSELSVSDIFDQALVIHRVQFLLSALLMGVSGYLVLRAIFHKTAVTRAELLLGAWLGALIWFWMHGTWSMAIGGGPDSYAVMSWLSWYSLNYQISLPFSMFSSAALLYAVSMPLSAIQRSLVLLLCVAAILITTVVHAAEVPYFLFSALIIGVLYVRGRRAVLVLSVLVAAALAFVHVALRFSDRVPELIHFIFQGDWSFLVEKLSVYGQGLVDHGLNRSPTGWNTLTSISLGLLPISIWMAIRSRLQVALRPVIFSLATGLMPLALLFKWSAGLLAMVTYLYVAWRFAFASFLFLGIPVFIIMTRLYLGKRMGVVGQMALAMMLGVVALSISRWLDANHIVNRFANSLVQSLDAESMYFGLLPEESKELDAMHTKLVALNPKEPLCVDVFSANYLFFLKGYRNVYLPGNLELLPTVEHLNETCQFPRDGGDLRTLGVTQPSWRFNLVQSLAD